MKILFIGVDTGIMWNTIHVKDLEEYGKKDLKAIKKALKVFEEEVDKALEE